MVVCPFPQHGSRSLFLNSKPQEHVSWTAPLPQSLANQEDSAEQDDIKLLIAKFSLYDLKSLYCKARELFQLETQAFNVVNELSKSMISN